MEKLSNWIKNGTKRRGIRRRFEIYQYFIASCERERINPIILVVAIRGLESNSSLISIGGASIAISRVLVFVYRSSPIKHDPTRARARVCVCVVCARVHTRALVRY